MAEGRFRTCHNVLVILVIAMQLSVGSSKSVICSFTLDGVVCHVNAGNENPTDPCYNDTCLFVDYTCTSGNVTYDCQCDKDANKTQCTQIEDSTVILPPNVTDDTETRDVENSPLIRHINTLAIIVGTLVSVIVLVVVGSLLVLVLRTKRRRRASKTLVPPPHKDEVGHKHPHEEHTDTNEQGTYKYKDRTDSTEASATEYLSLADDNRQTPAPYTQLLKREVIEDNYTGLADGAPEDEYDNEYQYITSEESNYYNVNTQNAVPKHWGHKGNKTTRSNTHDDEVIYQNV